MPLNYYAQLASDILSNNTKYQKDREIINSIFIETLNLNNDEKVIARLSTIDGFYSTQMNKRIWGIEEISYALNNISINDDDICNLAIEFISNPQIGNPILELIENKYGYNKKGEVFGKAPSLITKYLYFVSNFRFPIYDKLLRKSYNLISLRFPEFNLIKLKDNCDIKFFHLIKNLNLISEINNYERLDNFLWLYGKIREGSFSLIFSKENYLELVNIINNNIPVNDIDNSIRLFLQDQNNNNQILNFLGNEQGNNLIEFCHFCFNHIMAI